MVHKEDDSKANCLPCRLISGFGLVGIGVYIFFQSRTRTQLWEVNGMKIISAAFVGFGLTRLLDLKLPKAKDDIN